MTHPLADWQQRVSDAIDASSRAHVAAHAFEKQHGRVENTHRAHAAIHEALAALERAGRLLGCERTLTTADASGDAREQDE